MKVIGLTGGTGSGKSTVAAYLKGKGCHIIDADKISRELTAKGGEALGAIMSAFGQDVFFEDGSLDRKKLGTIVFNDTQKLKILEGIITRKVIELTLQRIAKLKVQGNESIVVLDAPLLFECGMNDCTDENWLVICEQEQRVNRLMKRDGMERQSIFDRMANQLRDDEKIILADYIIDNSGTLEELYRQIDSLIERVENEKK
ncbi:MAG: dephospho-CoA kinase [Firmicutes bacterium]|nr:dephospho-CoA kinase [Bacillota bacterium]